MDNIQLYYIDNEINKIDKMKQGDVIYKNGVELLVVFSICSTPTAGLKMTNLFHL